MEATRLQLLIVTDDEALREQVRAALQAGGVAADLHPVDRAPAALEFLRCEGGYAGPARGLPDLVLLDLDSRAGSELLAEMTADPRLTQSTILPLASDSLAAMEKLGDLPVQDVVSRPPTWQELGPVLSYLDEA